MVIEHNMKVIMSLAQRIFCLAHGKMLAEGSPNQIKNDKRVVELIWEHSNGKSI